MEIVTENQNITYYVYASVGVNLVPDLFINHHDHPTVLSGVERKVVLMSWIALAPQCEDVW